LRRKYPQKLDVKAYLRGVNRNAPEYRRAARREFSSVFCQKPTIEGLAAAIPDFA
jgi:hypothetical protein